LALLWRTLRRLALRRLPLGRLLLSLPLASALRRPTLWLVGPAALRRLTLPLPLPARRSAAALVARRVLWPAALALVSWLALLWLTTAGWLLLSLFLPLSLASLGRLAPLSARALFRPRVV
jgi:hypothetical protein